MYFNQRNVSFGSFKIEVKLEWKLVHPGHQLNGVQKKHFVYPKTLLEYIKNDQSITIPSFDEINLDPNDQLQKLKTFLASHYDELVSFLNQDDFAEHEAKIESFALDKFNKIYPNIKFQT